VPSNRRTVTRSMPKGWSARQSVRRLTLVIVAVALLVPLSSVASSSLASAGGVKPHFVLPRTATTGFPKGVPNLSEPSGEAPPSARSFPGYVRKYVQDFNGTSLPPNWVGLAVGECARRRWRWPPVAQYLSGPGL
jgi:hypothetical protein